MEKITEQLQGYGFQKLPGLDPTYFTHRERVGFLLLVQVNKKLRYHLHTVNAMRCLETARNAVLGYYADRAVDLKAALQDSQLDDWEVYFRPNGLYPGLRACLDKVFASYQSLNTRRSELDPEEPVWSYRVFHEGFQRSSVINSKEELTDEKVVAAFLYRWRQALGEALRRETIQLPAYYAGCEQVAQASKQWMDNQFSQFAITCVRRDKRKHAVREAAVENFRQSATYHRQLAD